jgi:hypothetical protein
VPQAIMLSDPHLCWKFIKCNTGFLTKHFVVGKVLTNVAFQEILSFDPKMMFKSDYNAD